MHALGHIIHKMCGVFFFFQSLSLRLLLWLHVITLFFIVSVILFRKYVWQGKPNSNSNDNNNIKRTQFFIIYEMEKKSSAQTSRCDTYFELIYQSSRNGNSMKLVQVCRMCYILRVRTCRVHWTISTIRVLLISNMCVIWCVYALFVCVDYTKATPTKRYTTNNKSI